MSLACSRESKTETETEAEAEAMAREEGGPGATWSDLERPGHTVDGSVILTGAPGPPVPDGLHGPAAPDVPRWASGPWRVTCRARRRTADNE